jgi:hypothetical protein
LFIGFGLGTVKKKKKKLQEMKGFDLGAVRKRKL